MAGGPPSPRPSWGTSLCASPALTRPLEPRARGGATLPLQAGLSTLVPRTRVSGRAGERPACVLRSWRDAVSAALTCACMSTVVRTGRDAKAADRVPVSRDPRPLIGSSHKTRESLVPGHPPHPPHPPLLNFNRRAVNSPLNSQRPIRAGAAAASQSQGPPHPGPRPLSRDSSGPPEREN